MKTLTRKALATTALLVAAASANAALLTIEQNLGSVFDSGLNGNNIIGVGNVSGYWGANLLLSGPATVTFTFAGYEAGWNSNFTSGSDYFYNKTSTIGASFSIDAGTGYVPFTFNVTSGSTGSVSNGFNDSPTTSNPIFFLTDLGNDKFFIGLNDDGLGLTDKQISKGLIDADGDDLGVFVTARAAEVPVPSTLGLLGLGLAGLGMLRRRTAA